MNEKVNKLLSQARKLADEDPEKTRLCEQAVRAAEQVKDDKSKYYALQDLIEVLVFSGYPEKALVQFGWCIAKCDQQPELYPLETILWKYKWMVEGAAKLPSISKNQLEQLLNNMQQHYQQAGYSLRPVLHSKALLAYHMGEIDKSLQSLQQSQGLSKDRYTDCNACVNDFRVSVLTAAKQDKTAFSAADIILQGHSRCTEVPHLTYSALLLPATRLGRLELGHQYLSKGYQLIKNNPTFLLQIGLQLQYCAYHALIEVGLKRFQRHLEWLIKSNTPGDRFEFELGAALLFKIVCTQNDKLHLSLPQQFSLYQADQYYQASVLFEYFWEQAISTANAFDERNENYHYRQIIEERSKLLTL